MYSKERQAGGSPASPSYGAPKGNPLGQILNPIQPGEHGFATSMDVVSEQGSRFGDIVTPSLRYCDYLVINVIEASEICDIPVRDGAWQLNPGNTKSFLRKPMEKGVRKLTAIHAPEGGWCLLKDVGFFHRLSLTLPSGYIQGMVGVGDAFCAGMIYAVNHGDGPERSMDIGAIAAACILGK